MSDLNHQPRVCVVGDGSSKCCNCHLRKSHFSTRSVFLFLPANFCLLSARQTLFFFCVRFFSSSYICNFLKTDKYYCQRRCVSVFLGTQNVKVYVWSPEERRCYSCLLSHTCRIFKLVNLC